MEGRSHRNNPVEICCKRATNETNTLAILKFVIINYSHKCIREHKYGARSTV